MFQGARATGGVGAALRTLELIYHSTVRDIRKTHRSAFGGLVMNILQTVTFVAAFWLMFTLIGARANSIRGDYMLYLMSGIFLFLTHTKAVAAVVKSEGPTSPMMQHAPLNTFITLTSAALAALYLQLLSLFVMLFAYHTLVTPITIDQPIPALGMLLLAWFSGVAVGVVLLAMKPWAPSFVMLLSTIWSRANMVASGKMFVANTMPGYLLAMFDWNPLFHIIDQERGFVFLNYTPHFSSISYAVKVSLALIVLGLMGEFYTRRRASISWKAGQ